MSTDDMAGRLAAARHEAQNDDATVCAVVDGSGKVVEVRVESKAMRQDAARLTATITETLQAAQSQARQSLTEVVDAATTTTPDIASLQQLATELGSVAQHRLTDISSTLDRLLARGPGPGTER